MTPAGGGAGSTPGRAGPGCGAGRAGGRSAAGGVPRARGGGGRGAVGPARRRSHPVLRRPGRLAGRRVLEDHDHSADADLLAHHRPGVRRGRAATGRLAGLRRIGIDEISYKRGHKYLVIVVNHDTGLLIWAAPGREARTLHAFSGQLGEERCKLLTHLSADGADWISGPAAARAPQAVLCAGPFHVVSWATGALDEVRREVWRTARQAGGVTPVRHLSRTIRLSSGDAKDLKHARYALWVKPGEPHRPPGSQTRLDREDPPLPLARLPAQRRTADSIQTQRRRRQARSHPLAVLGRPLPHSRIHRTREKDPPAPHQHLRNPRPRTQQRPDRISEHQGKSHHPDGLRIPQPRRPHRAGHARPRRAQAPAPRKMITKPPTSPAGGPQY
jgi:Transposase